MHDYLTQRGGAERVVLSMLKAFPDSPLHTALYEPRTTFNGFDGFDVQPMPLNRVPGLRRHHRLALPALARSFSRHVVDADVVLCSSSGWAHGVQTTGRKVVYCYTPARWLYDTERYTEGWPLARAVVGRMRRNLVDWDGRAAASAHRYLTSSVAVQRRIRRVYGIEADVLSPPVTIDVAGPRQSVSGVDAGFYLCVSRLLPYKNVSAVVDAFTRLPGLQLVVAGSGPEEDALRRKAGANVRFAGTVTDDELRWLYSNCASVVAAGHEDFGLTPVEGAAFGRPSAVLAWGGFLDTVIEVETGVFFADLDPSSIAQAVTRLAAESWSADHLRLHAERFQEASFIARLREIVFNAHDASATLT